MRYIFIISALSILFSCHRQRIVSESELKAYILDPENGLRKQASKNDTDIEVLYRPSALVIAQQLDGVDDPQERARTKANFDSLSYFVLKLSRKGQEFENSFVSQSDKFLQVINHLNGPISRDIFLVQGNDTIRALDVAYTRMYGAATATTVMAIFPKDIRAANKDISFYLADTELGLGENTFLFNINDIKKAPTLNLN